MRQQSAWRARLGAVLLAGGLLWLAGCNGSAPKPNEIIARVGENYLTREVLQALVPKNIDEAQREVFMKRQVEQWIDNQILAEKAREEGFSLAAEDRWKINNLEAEILAAKYLDDKLKTQLPVTDKEVEDYYNAHQDEFVRSEDEVHLVHLYSEQNDNAIFQEIRQSQSLLEVIKKNLLDQRQLTYVTEPNGDLGYVPLSRLDEQFQKAIRGNKTGLIYGPIRANEGYHFLQVLDRQPAGSTRAMELVENDIQLKLQIARRFQKIRLLKENLRKDFPVETFYENIL